MSGMNLGVIKGFHYLTIQGAGRHIAA